MEVNSRFGTGSVFTVAAKKALAAKYEKSAGQPCLQRGYVPLPKPEMPARVRENMDIFSCSLSDEEVQAISSLTGCRGEALEPDTINFWANEEQITGMLPRFLSAGPGPRNLRRYAAATAASAGPI